MIRLSKPTFDRGGFTLMEALISTMLVSILLVTTLGALGNLTRHRTAIDVETLARAHAEELLNEILEKPYVDPNGESVPRYIFIIRVGDQLGPERNEANGSRLFFDDVDDYHQWTSEPMKRRDGSVRVDPIGWRRSVAIDYVRPHNLSVESLFDLGVKRISVKVYQDGELLAESVAFRTRGWDEIQWLEEE